MNLTPGDRIGAYEIVGHLGQGGMATVYKAYHERLDRHVAIKLMHATFLQDEDFRARFQREARIVARLEHPAIVPIYDYNEHENTPYLVMKFIEGMTLKKRVIKTGLTLEQSRDFLMRVAEGLDYAHKRGILHRDMKPSNILLDQEDQAYIADFGLARIAEAGASTISTDMMLGTPYYISPEQAQGSKDLSSRTDLYSMGVILYELITGEVPFQADTPYAIVHGHIYASPRLPSEVNPNLPRAVDIVIRRALAKRPEDRFNTAVEMMHAFTAALQGEKPRTAPAPTIAIPVEQSTAGATTNRFDDLGDHLMLPDQNTLRQATPPARRNSSDSANGEKQKVTVQGELDLSKIDFEDIGERIKSGVYSLAEMIEDRIDTELRQRRGIALTEEEVVRRRVLKRTKARNEFVRNLSSYIMVNALLIGIWFFLTGAGFFWPGFPLFFWGMGLVSQAVEYYTKFGPGAVNEASIEAEIRREMARRNSGAYTIVDEKEKHDRLSLDDIQGGNIRLNEEGELTDSFVKEQRRR
jgi:serine/threonine protein kinase